MIRNGRSQAPEVILATPVDVSLLPEDFGVRHLSQAVSENMGVSSNFIICDRNGPVADSSSTRGKNFTVKESSNLNS